ncbi:MAG: hypothetical protein HNEKOMLI_00033 [Sodalis sp. Psp]|nr:hypothetical protein [Sodalis sp. Psp]MCR3756540.1 hypothetical protein [Sodalis sp. Ppy]
MIVIAIMDFLAAGQATIHSSITDRLAIMSYTIAAFRLNQENFKFLGHSS